MYILKYLRKPHRGKIALKVLSMACAAVLAGCGSAPPSMECDAAALYSTIETLCSDSLAGRRAGSGNDLRAARILAARLHEAGCTPLWHEALVPFPLGDAAVRRGMDTVLDGAWCDSSYNVVMTIPSRYPTEHKVLLGAHYDHMGLFKADKGKNRAGELLRGANDNASGTAAVVEIARCLRPYADDFRRDLVVVLFGAEEMGLIGSRNVERMLRDSAVAIGHMVNLEMLGRMRGDTLCLQGERISPVGTVARSVATAGSLYVDVSMNFSVGSDHIAFAQKMYPVSFFVTTDASTLHTVDDTPESLNMQGMERAVNYITRYVYALLTADDLPKLRDAL